MATIKSYTDISQSRKLSEILSLESADQTWARIAIAGANLDVPEELQYRHNGDMPFQYYSGIGTPCWSLAALLGVLPAECECMSLEHINYGNNHKKYFMSYVGGENTDTYDNPVDACVDMIERLHVLRML